MPPLRTLPSRLMPAKSRLALSAGPIALPNTTNCCASSSSWVTTLSTQVSLPCRRHAGNRHFLGGRLACAKPLGVFWISCLPRQSARLSLLSRKVEHRGIMTAPFTFPPGAGSPTLCRTRKTIVVQHGSNIAWWLFPERIVSEQARYRRGPFKERQQKTTEPGIICVPTERGKPHLPIQSGLVRSHETRR